MRPVNLFFRVLVRRPIIMAAAITFALLGCYDGVMRVLSPDPYIEVGPRGRGGAVRAR